MARTDGSLAQDLRLDVYDKGYAGWCILFVMYGFMDSAYNCYAFWLIGAFSNDPAEVRAKISAVCWRMY